MWAGPASAQLGTDLDPSDRDIGASIDNDRTNTSADANADAGSSVRDTSASVSLNRIRSSADADASTDRTSSDANSSIRLGGTTATGDSSTDTPDRSSSTTLRLGTVGDTTGGAAVDLNGDGGDDRPASVGFGLGPSSGGGAAGGGAGMPPIGGSSVGDDGTGLAGLASVTSRRELSAAIADLDSNDRTALQLQCGEILARPKAFDPALVSLCRIAIELL